MTAFIAKGSGAIFSHGWLGGPALKRRVRWRYLKMSAQRWIVPTEWKSQGQLDGIFKGHQLHED